MEYKVGDRIVWHTGFYGAEQGQRTDSWWPEDKAGKVVQIKKDRVLIELKDHAREWANIDSIERV
jgi:hypothetical protein